MTEGYRSAHVSRNTVYRWREEDDTFVAMEHQAKEEFADSMEREAVRRARDGTLKPIYQAGVRVGYLREYSDTLLIFMLKAARPDKYRERVDFSFKAQEAARSLAEQLGLDAAELLSTAADIAAGHSEQLLS